MGNQCSKTPRRPKQTSTRSNGFAMTPRISDGDRDVMVKSIRKDDQNIIDTITKELHQTPQIFVINNMILSTQFFGDHKEIIKQLQHASSSPREKELNKTLLKDEIMECTNPDVIFEKVHENVIFRSYEEDSQPESLVARRTYVINDLIEVVNSNEIPQYTSIDKPSYQVKIEESNRKGFVKLQQVEVTTTPKIAEYATEYEPTPGPSSRPDSEYDYTRITELRTPKPLEVEEGAERRDTLPETCFSTRKVRKIPDEYFDDDNIEYLQQLASTDLFKEITYINSSGFMKYFQNVLFPGTLGKTLGYDEESLSYARAIPGKIFCDELDLGTNVITSCEVVPSVSIQWPQELTFEFIYREDRPTFIDTRTGINYRWPTTDMVKEITSMNCCLVPKGYVKKKGEHQDSSLEWEIHFPKAERYLEARMSHAQMKCYLVLLTLHKTFIAPVTRQQGLLVEHIRTHMFWECEANYRNWPEHRLGTKLLIVIKNLAQRLFQCTLPNFFIKQQNLFDNIPKKYLQFAQKTFLKILESPAPHFIKALRNLRYTSGKFYSPLDYRELYTDLTAENSITLINQKIPTGPRPTYIRTRKYDDPELQWKHIQELQKKKEILRKRREAEEKQAMKEAEAIQAAASQDWLNLEVKIDKTFDNSKVKAILVLFLRNFIEIAKVAKKVSVGEQAEFYLKQASYLTVLLEETAGAFIEEAREYKAIIFEEEERIKRKAIRTASQSSDHEKPSVPLRNEITQQIGKNSVRLHKLQTSFANGPPPVKMTNLKPKQSSFTNRNAPKKSVAFA
ncbi:uncharacterized protein LOC132703274 [Cylas formicarius]|uniref:uncharacterized protein LOC132703274 n=1 Tax=Cylas formicarius TaxID=197179 RepID=UPI0029587924|nr:uncharacterized protein LOC132703274 [Cylas formicarius]